MQNEKAFDLPPVLFKSAGERWGNDDNLWVRLNGMVDNLFMVDNSMEGETAIFKTGGQAWVITRAEKLFAKTIACKHISNKLNILSARSDIIGNPGWSDREVLNFLIGQIVQMPTIDREALARDVFVDGDARCRGLFGKISNSSISGAMQLRNIQSVGRVRSQEVLDSLPDPRTLESVDWEKIRNPIPQYFQPGGFFNAGDSHSSREVINRAVGHLAKLGKTQENGVDAAPEAATSPDEFNSVAFFKRLWGGFANDTDDPEIVNSGNKNPADFIIGIDPGRPDSGITITHLNYGRGKHRDYEDGAVERNKYMTHGSVMDLISGHQKLFEIEKRAGKTPSPDNISEEKLTFDDQAKFHYVTLSGKTLFEHLHRHQGVKLDLEENDATVSLNNPDADDLQEFIERTKLSAYKLMGLPPSFFGFSRFASSEARRDAKDKLLKLYSSDVNGPHKLVEGYNGEEKELSSDKRTFDPLMKFITSYYGDSFGDDSEHLRKLKSGYRPFVLTEPVMVKLDITAMEKELDVYDIDGGECKSVVDTEAIMRDAERDTEILLAGIKDAVKDGEVRSESEQYLVGRVNKAKE